jgi:hypothetical protein
VVVVVAVAAALMIMPMATTAAALEDDVGYAGSVGFDEGFSPLFGEANMERSADGRGVRLTLNRYSGSGFISKHYYHHGFFSADVTLPKDHTAGVVVAFYVCQSSIRPEYIFLLALYFLLLLFFLLAKLKLQCYFSSSVNQLFLLLRIPSSPISLH